LYEIVGLDVQLSIAEIITEETRGTSSQLTVASAGKL
jgi:hypothetical protein